MGFYYYAGTPAAPNWAYFSSGRAPAGSGGQLTGCYWPNSARWGP